MQKELISFIRCPICEEHDFAIVSTWQDHCEIREGHLICQGWIDMHGEMSDDLVDTMLTLPYYDEDPMWINVGHNFDRILAEVDVTGKIILDLGAGRCRSSRRLMQRGVVGVVALDILTTRYIGLETAEIYFDIDGSYFERVIGDMNDLPLQDAKFDIVFSTATIHHSSDLERAFEEIARTLVPGELAMVINEPVRRIGSQENLDGSVEVEHGINEHTYTIVYYLSAAHHANLRTQLLFPGSVANWLQDGNWNAVRDHLGNTGARVVSRIWKHAIGILQWQPILWAIYAFSHAFPLVMIAQNGNP